MPPASGANRFTTAPPAYLPRSSTLSASFALGALNVEVPAAALAKALDQAGYPNTGG